MVFAIHQYESAIGTHVSPPSPSELPPTSLPTPSLQVITEPAFGCPLWHMKPALVSYFTCGNVYVSVLFTQIISPSSPTESKSLFFNICVLEGEVLTTEPPGKSQGQSLKESGSQSWSSGDVWFCWPWRRNQSRSWSAYGKRRLLGAKSHRPTAARSSAQIRALSRSMRPQPQQQLVGPWTENPATLWLDSWSTDTVRE